MSKFNLLPPEVVKKRRHRRINIYLMTAQIAVFLLAAFSFPAANGYEAFLLERYAALDISDPKYELPDRIAAEIARLNDIAETRDSVISSLNITSAGYVYLAVINENVPKDTELASIELTPETVEVTCLTSNISVIETHRALLLNTQMWEEVLLGEITVEGDRYQYRLIGVMNEA